MTGAFEFAGEPASLALGDVLAQGNRCSDDR